MKRSPIKRKRRKAREGDDPKRLAFVRMLPCCVAHDDGGPYTCNGKIESHHPLGLRWGKGMSTKSEDRFAIPLCAYHHSCFHVLPSNLGLHTREQRNGWQDAHVERVMKLSC